VSHAYQQLLDATVQHLRDLRERGVRQIVISPETLAALAQPVTRSVTPAPARMAVASAPPPVAHAAVVSAVALTQPGAPAIRPPAPGPAQIPATTGVFTDKTAAMAALRERALICEKCPHLVRSRRQVVFGVGNVNADLMFVGEAPGMDEDRQGEPFVGRAGQLLTKIIVAMGLTRQNVYIGNILKCRPDTPNQGYGNRKPTMEEMETCIPWLLEQIAIIQPKVLVGLGATAIEGLTGGKAAITRMRGQWLSFQGIPLMPTFHPSFLLHGEDNPAGNLQQKRLVWEDMMAVMERFGLPISEKQRGFFKKAVGG
jgi:DNA polymerase